jgi:hypothetical protein
MLTKANVILLTTFNSEWAAFHVGIDKNVAAAITGGLLTLGSSTLSIFKFTT